jgi:plasmid stabilization system protein ParE
MSFELKFTPEAEETYKAVILQLRSQWSDAFALKFEIKVLKCLNLISSTPYLYSVVEGIPDIRKCFIHKNCAMFYRVNEESNVILIVCFWDNRQDPIVTI